MEAKKIYQTIQQLAEFEIIKGGNLKKDFHLSGCSSYGSLYDDNYDLTAFIINNKGEARQIETEAIPEMCSNANGSWNDGKKLTYENIAEQVKEDDKFLLINEYATYSDTNGRNEDNSMTLLYKIDAKEMLNYIKEKEAKKEKELWKYIED